MVVVVMVAVALIVAMVNPFLDFETSGSGDGVDNNNNNGEFGQERKKAGTPSRVIVGSPVTSEAQAIPRHGEATIVTQHERCFPGSSLRVVKDDREDGQDGLLQAYSCVRMKLKPGTGRGYRQKQDVGQAATTSQVLVSFQVLSLIKASQVPSRPGVAAPLPLELVPPPNICCPLVKSGKLPSYGSWNPGLPIETEVVAGGVLNMPCAGDMSRALGARVALIPSYDGWKLRCFISEAGVVL